MWNRKRSPIGRSGLTAFIDEDSEIEGRYVFKGTLMLNGRLKGDISSADILIIGEKGSVTGDIRAGQALISGEVVGNAFTFDAAIRKCRRFAGRRASYKTRGPCVGYESSPWGGDWYYIDVPSARVIEWANETNLNHWRDAASQWRPS